MASDLIPLRDGPTVPATVIEWLLGLDARGLTIAMGTDGLAYVSDMAALTAADRVLIEAHRLSIRAAVRYCETVAAWPLDRLGTPWTPQARTPCAAAPSPSVPATVPTTPPSSARPELMPLPLWGRPA